MITLFFILALGIAIFVGSDIIINGLNYKIKELEKEQERLKKLEEEIKNLKKKTF